MTVEAPAIRTSKNSSAARLAKAVSWSESLLKSFRAKRVKFLKQYGGPFYTHGLGKERPLNLLQSVVTILVPSLMVDPHYQITHNDPDKFVFVESFRLAGDDQLREMGAKATFRKLLVDSLFGPAIAKTGLGVSGTPGYDEAGNILEDPGKPFSQRVSFDDYIPDMTASSREAYAFEGNKYSVPFEWAMGSGLYDKKLLEANKTAQVTGATGRADSISWPHKKGGGYQSSESYIERCDLMDLWLPGENMIVTLPADPDRKSPYLAERPWEGPETGPYDVLDLCGMPDNLIGVPILSVVYELYVIVNCVLAKQSERTRKEKDIGVASTPEDVEALRDASHGDAVVFQNPKDAKILTFGGATDAAFQSITYFLDLFNRAAGNPELLSGLGPQANTLGQDQLNLTSAQFRISDWREQVFEFADSVLRKIAWFLWTDPVRAMDLTLALGGGVKIPLRWDPEAREGEFMEYAISVNATHQPRRSPQESYDRLVRWLTEIVLPLAQLGAAQGMALDVAAVAKLSGRDLGIEGADRIFRAAEPIQGANMQIQPQADRTTINMGGTPKPTMAGGGQKKTVSEQEGT